MNFKSPDYSYIKKIYLKFLKKKEVASKPLVDKIGKLNTFYLPLLNGYILHIKKIIKLKLLDYRAGKEQEKAL